MIYTFDLQIDLQTNYIPGLQRLENLAMNRNIITLI